MRATFNRTELNVNQWCNTDVTLARVSFLKKRVHQRTDSKILTKKNFTGQDKRPIAVFSEAFGDIEIKCQS